MTREAETKGGADMWPPGEPTTLAHSAYLVDMESYVNRECHRHRLSIVCAWLKAVLRTASSALLVQGGSRFAQLRLHALCRRMDDVGIAGQPVFTPTTTVPPIFLRRGGIAELRVHGVDQLR